MVIWSTLAVDRAFYCMVHVLQCDQFYGLGEVLSFRLDFDYNQLSQSDSTGAGKGLPFLGLFGARLTTAGCWLMVRSFSLGVSLCKWRCSLTNNVWHLCRRIITRAKSLELWKLPNRGHCQFIPTGLFLSYGWYRNITSHEDPDPPSTSRRLRRVIRNVYISYTVSEIFKLLSVL